MAPPRMTPVGYDPKEPIGYVTVVSIFPFEHSFTLPGQAPIRIPACPPGVEYVTCTIRDAIIARNRGNMDGDYDLIKLRAAKRAHGILKDTVGAFLIEGDKPTPEELATQRAKLENYWRSAVEAADLSWNMFGKRRILSRHAFHALKVLGYTREWASSDVGMGAKCPRCERAVSKLAGRCVHCQAIVNWQYAYDGGQLDQAHIDRGVQNGWIVERKGPAPEAAPMPNLDAGIRPEDLEGGLTEVELRMAAAQNREDPAKPVYVPEGEITVR